MILFYKFCTCKKTCSTVVSIVCLESATTDDVDGISPFVNNQSRMTKLMMCFVLQENVSCLNTTLVFLMFANQKNRMPQYLRALAQERSGSGECSGNCNIMKNFRDLLLFWQDHYLHKDKDCSALEKVRLNGFFTHCLACCR